MPPTAITGSVFARWLRMEVAPDTISGHFNVTVEMEVSVAGERVRTFTTYVSLTEAEIQSDLADAIESKRSEFVTA